MGGGDPILRRIIPGYLRYRLVWWLELHEPFEYRRYIVEDMAEPIGLSEPPGGLIQHELSPGVHASPEPVPMHLLGRRPWSAPLPVFHDLFVLPGK